jgi:hypothetical protein
MLDLLAVLPLDHLGTTVGAGAAAYVQSVVQGVVEETSTIATPGSMSVNAGLVLLGFVIGLCAEMRKSD